MIYLNNIILFRKLQKFDLRWWKLLNFKISSKRWDFLHRNPCYRLYLLNLNARDREDRKVKRNFQWRIRRYLLHLINFPYLTINLSVFVGLWTHLLIILHYLSFQSSCSSWRFNGKWNLRPIINASTNEQSFQYQEIV